MAIKNLTESDFDDFISQGNAVIDFYADWCGPCKIMAPEFEKASESMDGVNFGKVDIDKNPDLAQNFGVMSIPTTIFFKNKEPVDRVSGALTEEDIEGKVKANFNKI